MNQIKFAQQLRKNMTDAEKGLWRRLRSRQLGGFKIRRQVPIGAFIGDFVCFEAKLIIEVDGGQHSNTMNSDSERTKWFQSEGFEVLRFWNHEVLNQLDVVLEVILKRLNSPHLSPPPQGGRKKREMNSFAAALNSSLFSPSLQGGRKKGEMNSSAAALNSDPSLYRRKRGEKAAGNVLGFLLFLVSIIFPFNAYAVRDPGQVNVLVNGDFEQGLGAGNATDTARGFINTTNWTVSSLGGFSTPIVSDAIDGQHVLRYRDPDVNAGAGTTFIFQKIEGVSEGDFVSLGAFVRFIATDAANDLRLQLEFNDVNNIRIGNPTDTGTTIQTAGPRTFTNFSVSGTAPGGTRSVTFVIEVNTISNVGATVIEVDQAVATVNGFPIVFDTSASKSRLSKGNATFLTARVKNASTASFTGLQLVATIPEGFTFVDSASRLDGVTINSTLGSRVFTIGSLGNGEAKSLGFLLVAGGGVQIGKRYEVSFFVRDAANVIRSATKSIVLTIEADPLFDEGIIVGKVFDDQNENATQDSEEERGIPGVKLITEEGIVIVTGPYGRYHIPAVKPGRHVVKVDGHTLPQNTKFVSEESVIVKATEGMFHVVNFAVKLPESQIPKAYRDQLNVIVTSGVDMAKPELDLTLNADVLRMGLGVFEVDPIFKVKTNYADLIAAWRLEVRDQFGDEVWTGYGLGAPPTTAPWNGYTDLREPIDKGVYSYRLIVRDADGREDWTPLKYFRVVSKLDQSAPDEPKIEMPSTGHMNLSRNGKRSIPVVAKPKILVRGETIPWNKIKVNGEEVGVNLDGTFQAEFYAPAGNQSVVVTTTDRDGNEISYEEQVQLKENYFVMAALGEEELGLNLIDGNVEVVGRDDRFDHGFYQDGRLAFYLKGKIKGKFLVTSRYDTDDPKNKLFTNLDPDLYYPVYGDGSEINYEAHDTKNRFFILVEKDSSFLKWGNFNTHLRDTELSTHNRTFNGGKLYYESLATTRYGEPQKGFVVYTADVDQLADHNEFLGTNGSLFYLRNKNVIEGSDKVRVELRDSIQDITINSFDLRPGTDYEIDYGGGRIILNKPLSAVGYSPTLISNDILKGSKTYLIVDYEFDAQGFIQDKNNGIRGYMHMGDHVKVGATALEDKQPDGDYDLRGVDATVRLGQNTKISAEYARTQRRTTRNAISFDGGITFTDIETGNTVVKKSGRIFDDAYSIKGETKLKTGTEVSGYVQHINAGFSNADLISQAGKRKMGVHVRQPVGEYAELTYRFDKQKATDTNNLAGVFLTSPDQSNVHNVRVDVDYQDYVVVGEYRNQNVDALPPPAVGLQTALDEAQFRNAFALEAGYRMPNGVMPFIKGQVTGSGDGIEANHQFGGGVEALVMDGNGSVRFEQLIGTLGDSTRLTFNVKANEKTDLYTALSSGPASDGSGRVMNTTIGSSSQVNSRSRFYSEQEYSSYQNGDRLAKIMGYDATLDDRWGVGASFERSFIHDITDVNTHRNAGAAEVRYTNADILKIVSRLELRADAGKEERIHWLVRDTVDWKLSEDLKFRGRFNRSDTNRFEGIAMRTDASTTELNMGFAYRPAAHSRWNGLAKYTWLNEVGAEAQFDTPDIFGVEVDQSSHILAFEFGYEALPPLLEVTEKLAYRRSTLTAERDTFYISNFLWAARFNFHVIRKWDIILEYRLLRDFELLDNLDHGALVEIDREFFEYMNFGVGYNFTRFDDDLRSLNSISRQGFFTRVSGKF